jgi:NADH-quinone oxidoreductase subunit N
MGVTMTGNDPSGLIPEIALLLSAVVGLLLGAWTPRRRQWMVRALAAFACVVGLVATGVAATGPDDVVFGTFSLDTATHTTRAIVLAATLLVIGLCGDRVAGHRRETEFVVLVQLGALGSIALGGATDLIMLFAAFLLASVPLYALAGWSKQGAAPEAALKYYLAGALAGVTTAAGVTLLFGVSGATGYQAVAQGVTRGPVGVAAIGMVAVLAGLAFKAGAVPAHFWVPDASDGTPPAVAAALTTLPKIGALVAISRLLDTAIPVETIDWPLLVAVLAAVSMTLGNLAAFAQTSVLRLLGYSTVSQVGYLLMAVAVAGRSGLTEPALLFYLAAYAVTNIAAFGVAAATGERALDGYRGLFHRDPLLALSLVVALLGLVGTPPTAVFLGKLVVFAATIQGGLAWLVVLAVINTVASLFYYLRWIAPAFREPEDSVDPQPRSRGWARRTALASAALSLVLGLGGGAALAVLGAP